MSRRTPAPRRTMTPVVGRIRRRTTFRALARPDGRAKRGPVSVAFSHDGLEAVDRPVVGYAIGRSHGGAVERNRQRRRLRAAVQATGADLPTGAYLLRAGPAVAGLGFAELRRSVREAALAAAGTAGGRDGLTR